MVKLLVTAARLSGLNPTCSWTDVAIIFLFPNAFRLLKSKIRNAMGKGSNMSLLGLSLTTEGGKEDAENLGEQ